MTESISPQSEWVSSRKQTNAGKDTGEKEPIYSVGENVNQCNHSGNEYGDSSKN
jgi:hypothetical protein